MRKSFIAIAIGATLTAGFMAGCSSTETKLSTKGITYIYG